MTLIVIDNIIIGRKLILKKLIQHYKNPFGKNDKYYENSFAGKEKRI